MFLGCICQMDIQQARERFLVHIRSTRGDYSMERFGGKCYVEEAIFSIHLLSVPYAHEGVQSALESL